MKFSCPKNVLPQSIKHSKSIILQKKFLEALPYILANLTEISDLQNSISNQKKKIVHPHN